MEEIKHGPNNHEWEHINEAKLLCSCGEFKYISHTKDLPEEVSAETLWDNSFKIQSKMYRIFLYVLYLSGARLNEGLAIRRKDFQINKIRGKEIYSLRLITLKNRISRERIVPIIEDSPTTSKMIQEIKEYIEGFKDEDRLFKTYPMAVQRTFRRVIFTTRAWAGTENKDHKFNEVMDNYTFSLHPHYLRHCRTDHLLNKFDLSGPDMMSWMGWSNMNPLKRYGARGWQSIAEKMLDKL